MAKQLVLPAPASANRSRAQVVADHLQDLVREQGLPAGENLGTRAQLREALGTTGATVDGAIRILVDRGVVRVKSGIGGGVFVADPDSGGVMLGGSRWSIRSGEAKDRRQAGELLSVVHTLYPMVKAEAALSRDESDLARMRAALDDAVAAGGDVSAYEMAHHRLHQAILLATHNGVLIDTLNPLLTIHHETMEPAVPSDGSDPADWVRERVEVHRAIVDAIEAQDCEQVWIALLRHGVTREDLSADRDMLPAGFIETLRHWQGSFQS